jgi:hypothetical protein
MTSREQLAVASRFGVLPSPPLPAEKAGVALNVRDGVWPINGLRHPVAADTTGWYIWAGEELSEAPDFFAPVHIEHLATWCPIVVPYLALPPGWRFLLAPDYEDVWYDETLLALD